jgi:hypothetical protein
VASDEFDRLRFRVPDCIKRRKNGSGASSGVFEPVFRKRRNVKISVLRTKEVTNTSYCEIHLCLELSSELSPERNKQKKSAEAINRR